MKKYKRIVLMTLIFMMLVQIPCYATIVGESEYGIIQGEDAEEVPLPAPPPAQPQVQTPEPAPTPKPKKKIIPKVEEPKEKEEVKESVSENMVSQNTISENTVSENAVVSENTISENEISEPEPKPEKKEKTTVKKQEVKKENPVNSEEKTEKQESKHIITTLLIAYLIVMVAAFVIWLIFFAAKIYNRNEEGNYVLLGFLFVIRKDDYYLIKAPSFMLKKAETGSYKLVFHTSFSNRHQNEALIVNIAGSEIETAVTNTVMITI